jgi:hypothetical protein
VKPNLWKMLALAGCMSFSITAGEAEVWDGYPPVPQPVRGKAELGVYIFPGWYRDKGRGDYPYRTHDEDSEWRAVARKPKPRPLLGFYDDSLPEVNDWHILWALEHGITWFAFDWYWNAGEHRLMRTLEQGFLQAKYAPMMKFCIHWCNHGLDWHAGPAQWQASMGLKESRVENGSLVGQITTNDPAFACPVDFAADQYTHLHIRLKLDAGTRSQLFWIGPDAPLGEVNSIRFPVTADGQFHDYHVDLRQSPNWQGKIDRLRLDPNADCPGSTVAVDFIRLQRGADTREGELAWEFDQEQGQLLSGNRDFSPAALIEMTEYLADHYFVLPNYLTVDGRPMLMVWDTAALFQANGGPEGFRQVLDQMNAVLARRGIKELYLVSMGRNRAEKEAGFAAMTGYGYYGTPFDSPWEWGGGHSVPYPDMLRNYESVWGMMEKSAYLPYFPAIGSSWDSRPRHSERAAVVSDYTPDNFRGMCRSSLEHIGPLHNLAIFEAWNEWGEGSFIEPDQRYEFGFLDVIRETYTDAPTNHVDRRPTDAAIARFSVLNPEEVAAAKAVESQPYPDPPRRPRSVQWTIDQPLPEAPVLVQWEFTDALPESWQTSHLAEVAILDGVLTATVSGGDPQIIASGLDLPIADIDAIALRLKVPQGVGVAEVFWATDQEPELSAQKAFRFPVQRDGEWHTYLIRKQADSRWQGQLRILRLDTGRPGDRLELDWLRLLSRPPAP